MKPVDNNDQRQPSQKPAQGVVTVNDDQNPTPDERDAKIPHEPNTDRLRSERQSVRDSESKGESV